MGKPLHIVALLDGRPGHDKQTRGVLEALSALTPLEINIRRMGPPTWIRRARHMVAYTGAWLGFSVKVAAPGAVDLLIGTGATTHFPLVVLRRRWHTRAVTCMTPGRPWQQFFDLCFIPQHDQPAAAANVFETVGPPCPANQAPMHRQERGLILVGGIDTNSHWWDSDTVMDQISHITAHTPDKLWTISSSPRTPVEMLKHLHRFAARTSTVDFYPFQETPPGWIETAYGRHATVWVTADSVSMVYEALSTGCGVGILPVAWKNPQNKFQLGLENLYARGLAVSFNNWVAGQPVVAPTHPLNEARRCAEEILRRWWPDRLP
jgi:mitochondrial fission protein ELM1